MDFSVAALFLKLVFLYIGPFIKFSLTCLFFSVLIMICAGNNGFPAEPIFSKASFGLNVTICEAVSVMPYDWNTGIFFILAVSSNGFGAGPPPRSIQRKEP